MLRDRDSMNQDNDFSGLWSQPAVMNLAMSNLHELTRCLPTKIFVDGQLTPPRCYIRDHDNGSNPEPTLSWN